MTSLLNMVPAAAYGSPGVLDACRRTSSSAAAQPPIVRPAHNASFRAVAPRVRSSHLQHFRCTASLQASGNSRAAAAGALISSSLLDNGRATSRSSKALFALQRACRHEPVTSLSRCRATSGGTTPAPADSGSPKSDGSGEAPGQVGEGRDRLDASILELSETVKDLTATLQVLTQSLQGLVNERRGSPLGASGSAAAGAPELRQEQEQEQEPAGAQGQGQAPAVQEATVPEDELPDPYSSAGGAGAGTGAGGADEAGKGRAHRLAFRLQRAFVQARIEGLGKPLELALDDFVTACMEAAGRGVGLPEIQLQLILAEGSLPGAFSLSSAASSSNAPVSTEEGRLRTAWIRLVYSTLALAKRLKAGQPLDAPVAPSGENNIDQMDYFVLQTVKLAEEEGQTFESELQQQVKGGALTSAGVKAVAQSKLLVLLSLEKAKRALP